MKNSSTAAGPMTDTVRVFLSSPRDVADERALARQVLQSLPKEELLRGKIRIEEVSWDDPGNPVAMDARLTPQEAINRQLPRPSECDVVAVILWSRMGTPLPAETPKPDGTPYRSGTEWEFLDALGAAEKTGRPTIWVFRRDEDIKIGRKDPRRDEILRQGDAVDAFFEEFQGGDGSLKRSFHAYSSPSQFKDLFAHFLREWVSRRLSTMPAAAAPAVPASQEAADAALWSGNPYRGLLSFGAEHTAIFFGRGFETDALVQRVREGVPVLAVVGASGSGKSSLVAAGLLPRLAAGAVPGSRAWVQVRYTPAEQGDNPFRALALALLPHLPAGGRTAAGLAGDLARNPAGIETLALEILAGRPAEARLLLFADQFEELFTARVDPAHRQPFVDLLAAAAGSPRLRLVLSLRADYYEHCTRYPGLVKLLREGGFPLAAPTGRALAEIIEGPARLAGIELEPGLVDDILKDVGDGPGRLALMEFALAKLYELRRDHILTRAAYRDELGGVSGVIQGAGDKAVEGAGQAVLSEVFDALSEVDEQGGAVRKRAWKQDLSPAAAALAGRLEDARLLTADTDPATGRAWVEVAHEAVLRSWPRFRAWLEEFGAFKLWRKGLNEARRRWQRSRAPAELLSGPRLREARLRRRERPGWLSPEENDYIGRSLRRRRWTALGLGAAVVLLPLLVGMWFLWVEQQQVTHTVAYRLILARLGLYFPLRPDMVRIPPEGGCTPEQPCAFRMGSPPEQSERYPEECPRHEVTFARPFRMGKFEVTFDDWDVFRLLIDGEGGCPLKETGTGPEMEHQLPSRVGQDQNRGRGHRPVVVVSWDDARCYIHWLNGKLRPEHPYRLPTEAEWEYAARAGSPAEFFWGDDAAKAGDYAWSNENAGEMSHPVGLKRPNAFGLHDMAGNVWEWTADCWHGSYEGAPRDDSAWEQATGDCGRRVIRGGSWNNVPGFLRSAARFRNTPDTRYIALGFRLAQDQK